MSQVSPAAHLSLSVVFFPDFDQQAKDLPSPIFVPPSSSSWPTVTAHSGCVCKGKCATKKCPCKKDNVHCGSYCHPGRHCVNLGSRSHQWLNDQHVTAAQHLLKQHHPDVSGLQPTTLQLTRMFDVHQNHEFVQCLNMSSNHWKTVSTIGCPLGTINVYDSMHLGVPTSMKKVIADMMFCDKKFVTIRQVHVQQQMGGSDCGLFAIANAAALCNGRTQAFLCTTRSRWGSI